MLRGISNDEFARLLGAMPLLKTWSGKLGEFRVLPYTPNSMAF